MRAVALIAIVVAACGCWHHDPAPTPSQRFVTELSHGNSARAAQTWRKMSPEDRAAFAHSQGSAPQPNDEEVRKQLAKHFEDQTPSGFQTDSGGAEVSIPQIPKGASLNDLPGYAAPPAKESQ